MDDFGEGFAAGYRSAIDGLEYNLDDQKANIYKAERAVLAKAIKLGERYDAYEEWDGHIRGEAEEVYEAVQVLKKVKEQ